MSCFISNHRINIRVSVPSQKQTNKKKQKRGKKKERKRILSNLANVATEYKKISKWCIGYPTAQLYSTKPELRFSADSYSAYGVLVICNGEDLNRPGWRQGYIPFVGQPYHKNNLSSPS